MADGREERNPTVERTYEREGGIRTGVLRAVVNAALLALSAMVLALSSVLALGTRDAALADAASAYTPEQLATPFTVEANHGKSVMIVNNHANLEYFNSSSGVWKEDWFDVNLSAGESCQLRYAGDTPRSKVDGRLTISGTFDVSGNAMSLLNKEGFEDLDTVGNYAFNELFFGNRGLIDASGLVLPATMLSSSCYDSLFSGCTSLTSAPSLPATELAAGCYANMFSGCTSLASAPSLPATELAAGCYANMFSGCMALSFVCVSFTNWNEDVSSTKSWLDGVTQTGVFLCPQGLVADTRDASHVPSGWEVEHPVCKIGDDFYLTAAEALAAAKSGQ